MDKNRKPYEYFKNENGWSVVKAIGMGIWASAAVAWLFYRSYYALISVIPLTVGSVIISRKKLDNELKRKMREQFREAMRIAADTLEAGYSMEQAFKQVEKEMLVLYGEKEVMVCEIKHINDQVRNKIPVEISLTELAEKMDDQDVSNLSRIMEYARKSGGNYVQIIRNFVMHLDEKMDTEKEIKANLAEKTLEYKVMCIMPLGIMALLNLQSGDFMKALYGNAYGAGVMSILLAIYIFAVLLGLKILKIKV